MSILVIDWIGACDKCNSDCGHDVETTYGDHGKLYVDDKVKCGSCGHAGVIDVYDNIAFAFWDEI